MSNKVREEHIAAVRTFNRFFLRQTGVLREGALETTLSVAEARVVFELAQEENRTATDLCGLLRIDAGYVSRLLANMERRGLIQRTRSERDGRQRLLSLTNRGRGEFALIDQRARSEVSAMLVRLSEDDRARLVEAMRTIEQTLAQNA